MKKQILSEEFSRMQKLAGLNEGINYSEIDSILGGTYKRPEIAIDPEIQKIADILDKLIESYGSGKFNDSVSVTPQTQRNTSTSFAFDTRFKESIANDILKYGN
jgi:hypothetical protein